VIVGSASIEGSASGTTAASAAYAVIVTLIVMTILIARVIIGISRGMGYGASIVNLSRKIILLATLLFITQINHQKLQPIFTIRKCTKMNTKT
jgi:hypothetical protein